MTKEEIKEQIVAIVEAISPNSIIADDIYSQLISQVDPGRTQEEIRGLIKELVNDDDNLIGSSNKGYFIIKTEEQLNSAEKYLTNRISHLQNRANNLRRLWNEQQMRDHDSEPTE